jgi:hypothetical protein
MSTNKIRDTHYVVLNGMHDDNVSKCWLRLLRYGVVFRIDAHADELENTSLWHQWRALMGTKETQTMASGNVLARWEQLCDLLIQASLPVMESLAPVHPLDRSLRKCFHTTTYHLRLTRDPESQAVLASVDSISDNGTLYWFQTAKVEDTNTLAPGIAQHSSHDVEIIGKEVRSSVPPSKVGTPDGAIHYFKACQQASKELGTSNVRNNSLEVILTYLQLHKTPLRASGIPSISGIVVDDGALAGILFQGIQEAESLADHLSAITTVELLEIARKQAPVWQARIAAVVAELHGRGIYLNEELWGCGIDQATLLVDESEEIWLPTSCISRPGEEAGEVHELAKRDNDAVQQVFGRFMCEEFGKLQALVGST